MDILNILSLGIGILGLGAFLGLFLALSRLNDKGHNTKEYLDVAESLLYGIKGVNDTLGKVVLPEKATNVIDRIIQTTQLGVQKAEQLYKTGQIPPDFRKDMAVEFSTDLLKLNGLEVNSELENAIQGVAESMVYLMPKTNLNIRQDNSGY